MTMSQMPPIPNFSNETEGVSAFHIAYYNERLRNNVFGAVMEAFYNEAKAGRITKAQLARRLDKRPEQISRWFSGPSNLTLDTVSMLLLGIGAELDPQVSFFRDKAIPNYAHPLIDTIASAGAPQQPRSVGFIEEPLTGTSTGLTLHSVER